MYAPGLGISENPFKLSPDPAQFFAASTHQCALQNIIDCIESRKSNLVVSGDAGTGKTTLLLKIKHDIAEAGRVLYLPYTNLGFQAFLGHIRRQLGIPDTNPGDGDDVDTLRDFLIQRQCAGEVTVLLIDEAQNLDEEALAQLCQLQERTATQALQVVFAGRPVLEQRLNSIVSGTKRELISFRLGNLRDEEVVEYLRDEEVGEYLRLRLKKVGCLLDDLFTQDTVTQLVNLTKGNPRLINIVCGNALAVADRNARTRLSGELIEVGAVMGAKGGESEEESGTRVETVMARVGVAPPSTTPRRVPTSPDSVETHEAELLQAMQEDIAAEPKLPKSTPTRLARARGLAERWAIMCTHLSRLASFTSGPEVAGNGLSSWERGSRRVLVPIGLWIQRGSKVIRSSSLRVGARITDATHAIRSMLKTYPHLPIRESADHTDPGVEQSVEVIARGWRHAAWQAGRRLRDKLGGLLQVNWRHRLFVGRSLQRQSSARYRKALMTNGLRNGLVVAGLGTVVVSIWLFGGLRSQGPEDTEVASDVGEFSRFSGHELRNRVNALTHQLARSLEEQKRLSEELMDVREERDWLAARLRGGASEDVGAIAVGGDKQEQAAAEVPQGQQPAEVNGYTVKHGDTLWEIAAQEGTTVAKLAAWNGIEASDVLRVGQQLALSAQPQHQPPNRAARQAKSLRYVVQRGDSLYRIAQRFDVTVAQLREWNNLAPDRHLQPRQQLKVFLGTVANASL